MMSRTVGMCLVAVAAILMLVYFLRMSGSDTTGSANLDRPVNVHSNAVRPSARLLNTGAVTRVSLARLPVVPAPPLILSDDDPVTTVLGMSDPGNYRGRLIAATRLGSDLNQAQCTALMEFLQDPLSTGAAAGLNGSQANTIKNEALNALLRQATLPEQLAPRVLAMAADASLDEQWRDYCIQHFVPLYRRMFPSGGVEDPDQAYQSKQVRDAFWSHVRSPGDVLTGTGLLSLDRLAEDSSDFDAAEIGRVALAVAAHPDSAPAARVTALQIAARRGMPETAGLARDLVSGATSAVLKMAAVASLGFTGSREDVPILESIRESGEQPLAGAAVHALRNLENRINTTPDNGST